MEMKIHSDAKGKISLDDITLRAKCHGNIISRFRLIVHYVNGVNFSQFFCDTRRIPA